LEGAYAENGGSDHFSVAVEIEQSTIKGHHQAMKEIQELSVSQEMKFEKTRVTITNPDDKEYILIFKNPKNLEKNLPSKKIKGKATASEFKKSIEKFYKDTIKSNINVVRTYKDAAGLVTTDKTKATEYVYEITVRKMINGVSTNSITFAKLTQSSQVTVKIELPTDVQ
jgi:hypothetical protein